MIWAILSKLESRVTRTESMSDLYSSILATHGHPEGSPMLCVLLKMKLFFLTGPVIIPGVLRSLNQFVMVKSKNPKRLAKSTSMLIPTGLSISRVTIDTWYDGFARSDPSYVSPVYETIASIFLFTYFA